ncbi:MAG: glycosyltransferase family 4 protein [Candidatus Nanohalobium sp.]
MNRIKNWSKVADEYLELMSEAGRIGIVTDTAETSSGVGRVSRELAENFSEKGLEVVFYTIEGRISEEKTEELEEEGVKVKEIGRGSSVDPREINQIRKIFEKDELDWINSHGFYLPMVAAFSNVNTLKTYHAHITAWSEVKKHPIHWIKWVLEEAPSVWLADERVSISEYAAKQMKRFYLSGSEVIYNGIDTERFREKETDYRSKIGLPEDSYVVGSLSALKKYKNQEKTLEIFTEEYADKENSYLLLGGDGPRREPLEKKVSDLGIEDKTKFLGYVPDEDLVDFYNAIDLFIYPSKWEGFGLPPLEAKLCGCETKISSSKTALKELNDLIID